MVSCVCASAPNTKNYNLGLPDTILMGFLTILILSEIYTLSRHFELERGPQKPILAIFEDPKPMKHKFWVME